MINENHNYMRLWITQVWHFLDVSSTYYGKFGCEKVLISLSQVCNTLREQLYSTCMIKCNTYVVCMHYTRFFDSGYFGVTVPVGLVCITFVTLKGEEATEQLTSSAGAT
jgi:hypothetical protein